MTGLKPLAKKLGMAAVVIGVTPLADAQEIKPPVAPIHPKIDTLFGHERVDNYYWLRGKEKPEVIDYLKAENAYTEAVMKHAEELRKKLYDEMVGRIAPEDLSVPEKRGQFYYYYREEPGKQYKIYCRKKGSLESPEEILLDLNILAEGKDFLSLGTYEISPDHNFLLYGTDETGAERYTLRVKNLKTGELFADRIENTSGSAVWANDNRTIFYTVPDDAWRPHKLLRHTIGSGVGEDVLVHHEPDDMFWMDIERSKSGAYLLMDMNSNTTSEAWYLDANNPEGEFTIIHPRQHGMEYYVYHRGSDFYIRTNENAKNFKMMKTPIDKPSKENWLEIVPHRDDVKIDGVDMFADHMVLYERRNGLKNISVTEFSANKTHLVEFPEPVYTFFTSRNPEFNSKIVRFTYMSLVSPNAVYDYDMTSHERQLMKEKVIPGGYDKTAYQSERVFATASDNTRIPISLVYRKGTPKDGTSPLLLYGYGSYGASMEPWFSTSRLSLLDRGVIYAMAHIRGGGEMGRYWYDQGKLLNKKNTFTDFISCGEYLIEQKYAAPDKLSCMGGSAGGLLIGAVVNMRPELFNAAVADVPFVDVVNTMLDETIPLTAIEWEEWGNPNIEKYYDYMVSYSPYDNVKEQAYPHMLIMAGLNDTRVQYWEPAKWTAKLRDLKTDNHMLLLKTQMGAGHGGASGRFERLKDVALEYAFLLDHYGIHD